MQTAEGLTAFVNGTANWFTFGGFWVTVVGFAVTIWQVVKTKSTTEAVQVAVGEVKQEVSREYLSDQLRDVLDDLSEVHAMHVAKVPQLATKRHAAAKSKLIRLAEDRELVDAEKVDLQASIVQLTSIQRRIESAMLVGGEIGDAVRLLNNLSKQIDRLTGVQASMRNRNRA